jgi:hypothetical protein
MPLIRPAGALVVVGLWMNAPSASSDAMSSGTMLGMSRTTSSKGLLEYELTLIREQDGTLRYEAHPSGQPVAVFTAVAVTADSVVFSAPEHDYPQTVGYRRAGADSVVAWIDGTSRGKKRRVDFPYSRVACTGAD